MAVTLQTLRNTFYNILREEESDASAYPVSLADLLLNSAQQNICFGNVINPVAMSDRLRGAKKGQLPFLFVDKFWSNVGATYLTDPSITGDSVLLVSDTTDYPSSGTLYVAGNIITYTGKTPTSFTGCTNILFDFIEGTQVSIVFDLPSDFASVTNVVYNNNFKLPGKLYDDVYEDLNNYKAYTNYEQNVNPTFPNSYMMSPFYTIKDNRYLIVWNLNQTGQLIKLRYEKKPTTMTSPSDTTTIDNDIYANTCISFYAVGEMLYNRGEEGRAAELLNFAVAKIQEMYTYYNNTSFEEISGIQVKSGKGKLNI